VSKTEKYIPALRFYWLTPLYDPLLKWGMREDIFKRHLIEQAQIKPGMHLLDLGCGTGTLTIMIKQMHPEVDVVGLDGDPAILEIAHLKAEQAGIHITLDEGRAYQLPYPDHSFDRVISSLVIHHLATENKQRTMHEIFRVLRPGGELHIVDFGKPHSSYVRLISLLTRRLEEADDNIKGVLPMMMITAGFTQVKETYQHKTIFGGLSLYMAKK